MIRPATPGTVYLVGAGPGDPSLITVRGLNLLRQADVVIYDRLVHPDLLDEVSQQAERRYVGKVPGRHCCPQEEINATLVANARLGRVVVRLKGGDPFVFGRGGEEGLALVKARVPFEIVPGVTSAVSVPAYAGIPVTHRHLAQAFTVITGHTSDLTDLDLDWSALARVGTLVILMGLGRIEAITERLIKHGCPPETPAAVIHCGSTAEQIVVEGTLTDIAGKVSGRRPPATIVVGEVVRLRHALDWFTPSQSPATGFPVVRRIHPPTLSSHQPEPARTISA